MSGIGSHTRPHRGATTSWLTPPEIIKQLGFFDLDPCCPPKMPWQTAERMVSPPGDGLAVDWSGSRIWLNPPYDKDIGKWLGKLSENMGTALVFARTETAWFFEHVWPKAAAILFLEGRLHFHYEDGRRSKCNAGGPSCLIAYGVYDGIRLGLSGIKGKFIPFSPHVAEVVGEAGCPSVG